MFQLTTRMHQRYLTYLASIAGGSGRLNYSNPRYQVGGMYLGCLLIVTVNGPLGSQIELTFANIENTVARFL